MWTAYPSSIARRLARVRPGRLNTPYRERILAYCAREGVVVPASFDRFKGSARLVVIDLTETPPTLVPRSTYLPGDVIAFLDRPDHARRRYRILDFRRGCELHRVGGKRLVRGADFAFKVDGELLSLVVP